MTNTQKFMTAAIVGILSSSTAILPQSNAADAASGKCMEANACKGKSACKGATNSCAGKNACAGKGWTAAKNEKDCKSQAKKAKAKSFKWVPDTAAAAPATATDKK